MYSILTGVTGAALSLIGLLRRRNESLLYTVHDVDVPKCHTLKSYDTVIRPSESVNTRFTARCPIDIELSSTSSLMESNHLGEMQLPGEFIINNCQSPNVKSSKTGSFASLNLSDSDGEESGYMSCNSGEPKTIGSKDIENVHVQHSESSNGSLNDLSSYDPNESCDQENEDVRIPNVPISSSVQDVTSSSTNVSSTSLGLNPQVQYMDCDQEVEDECSDAETDETDSEDEEEDGGDVDKEITSRTYTRQTTVVKAKEDDTDEQSSEEDVSEVDEEEDDDADVTFPKKKKKHNPPKRMDSTESEGTWISDSDEKCTGEKKLYTDDMSDVMDVGDFFEGLGNGITYSFSDVDTAESDVQSKDFFLKDRSSPLYGLDTDIEREDEDGDDDFAYVYFNDLKTGKRYAFPRKEPRTITDAVEFWETDFEVRGAIYPCMASWETKLLAPTYEEDADDFDKFNMYKSLYAKWVKCNRSREQWSQRYWGRSIETVAKMKGPPKMVTSQSDGAIDYKYTTTTPATHFESSPDPYVAERRRRRRIDSMQSTSACY